MKPTTCRRRATLAAGIAAGLILATGSAPAAAQDGGIAVGAAPEPVVLETLDGDRADLGDVLGQRPALIEFWASWCHICLALHPRVVEAHRAFGDDVEFLIIAVAVAQDRSRVRAHLERHPMPGHILWDARGEAVRAFDAPGTGFIVIVDGDGRVAYTGTGAEQDLVGALERVVRR